MSSLAANRRPVAILFLIVFIDLVGFGLLIPVIPLYAKFFGANEFTGSLLIATYSLLQFFFFNDTATTEIYTLSHTLSLHDALPISRVSGTSSVCWPTRSGSSTCST